MFSRHSKANVCPKPTKFRSYAVTNHHSIRLTLLSIRQDWINTTICYDDGWRTNPDPYERYSIRATGEMLNEAFYHARKALEKGNVEAHLIKGWFYEKGEVVQQDFV